ncbi:IclR family transcriptional regulator domain-containing protein [Phytoactinopolyspora mesophila]|uniref:Helix-turn-helix domain-containing protein n=1 Tax=Phytoactinopolyspora mesophila TaxID=2650750 RepID=A0A7K3M7F2_9ACTN|nr:helix-turn-helix domain-containing protein [Phytoactinopolyspora mesophila]
MTEPEARGTLGTVRNAVVLLDLLSEGPAYQQLTDLAERSGLAVPTVHRLLRSLVLADLVEQDRNSSRYGLGPEVARLSQRYLARLPILGALSPYLVPLRDTIGHTVHVAVLTRGHVVYVDRVDGSDGGLYRDTHRVHPAAETAAGRVLAARADEETWRHVLESATAELRKICENNAEQWRTAGYLVTAGHSPDEPTEIAVPVVDGAGRAVAALAATPPGSTSDTQLAEIASHLSRAGRAAGRTLSHG